MDKVIKPEVEALQKQINSLGTVGVVVDDKLGSYEHIAVSQKVITDAINRIWKNW